MVQMVKIKSEEIEINCLGPWKKNELEAYILASPFHGVI